MNKVDWCRFVFGAFFASLACGSFAHNRTTGDARDAKRGEEAYARLCIGCHSIEENRIGPKHRGLVGRRVGGVEGFKYSDALAKSTLTWDAALLDRWLEDPEATIKGQMMGFRVNEPKTRGEIIIYLMTQEVMK